jgi:hypothetical protein
MFLDVLDVLWMFLDVFGVFGHSCIFLDVFGVWMFLMFWMFLDVFGCSWSSWMFWMFLDVFECFVILSWFLLIEMFLDVSEYLLMFLDVSLCFLMFLMLFDLLGFAPWKCSTSAAG